MTQARTASRIRIRRSRLWFRVHSFIGLNLSLLLAFIFFTGALSVFSSELDWLLQPQMRAAQVTSPDDIAWAEAVAALADYAPDATIDTIEAGPSGIFAPGAYLRRPDGGMRVIYFDPISGAVQGEGTLLGAKAVLRRIHRQLLLPEHIGVPIVTALSFAILISLATALLFHKKWWRGFFRWPRRSKGARIWWGDVHRLVGVWSLTFLLVTTLTGIWYFTEETLAAAPGFRSAQAADTKADIPEAAARFPVALAAAREAFPELRIRRIIWPGAQRATFGFEGQDGTLLIRPRAAGVDVDLEGKVLQIRRGGEATVHQRISEAADPLHMGFWGGYWTKALWLLFGAMLTGLAVSGACVIAKRMAKEGASDEPRGRWAWLGIRRGLGVGMFALTIAVCAVLWRLPKEIALLG